MVDHSLEQRVNFNVGLGRGRQGTLCPFAGSSQSPNGPLVLTQILLVFPLEFLDEMVDHTVIEIFTSQVGISGSRFDFENSILDSQNGDIEGTTTQVENKYIRFGACTFFLVQTISDGSSSRFVDDSEDIEARNDTSILGSLSLRIIEIGWNSHNSVFHGLAQVLLSSFLHFGQNHRRNFFRGEGFVFTLKFNGDLWFLSKFHNFKGPMFHVSLYSGVGEISANQTLGVKNSVVWVHGHLIFSGVSDKPFGVREGHIGGCGSVTLVIGDDFDLSMLEHSNTGVGSSQIDSDCGSLRHIG